MGCVYTCKYLCAGTGLCVPANNYRATPVTALPDGHSCLAACHDALVLAQGQHRPHVLWDCSGSAMLVDVCNW